MRGTDDQDFLNAREHQIADRQYTIGFSFTGSNCLHMAKLPDASVFSNRWQEWCLCDTSRSKRAAVGHGA